MYYGEPIPPFPKFYALLCLLCWCPAIYFFLATQKSTDVTPAESRNLNEGYFHNFGPVFFTRTLHNHNPKQGSISLHIFDEILPHCWAKMIFLTTNVLVIFLWEWL
jgi:hypothetical protein